jgi:hypothetical protein
VNVLAWLLVLWLAPADLGSDLWPVREAAADRCASAGPLAWPFLWPLRASGDAETRARAESLTRRPASLLRDLATAHDWLTCDLDPARHDGLRLSDGARRELRDNPDATAAAEARCAAERARVADAFRRFGLLDYDERQAAVDNGAWNESAIYNIDSAIDVARLRYRELLDAAGVAK